ncbi:MAG: hypothetical protein JNM95_02885 [Chitinophagaceae bacterium]|nr:hypothetical protein [Chitinophagaceae bacterium]
MLLFQVNQLKAQCTCSGNLVTNPSFEAGTTGWGWSGGNLNAGTGAVACGSYSGDFQITNASSNWVSQEIFPSSYAAGGTINVSVYAGTHNNSYNNGVVVDFFDANWNWLSNSYQEVDKVLANSPAGPQLYTWSATIPSGVGHISVGFSGNGSWTKTDGWCVTFTASTCNNLTSPGLIGSDESFCGSSFDPALINNITSPSGGSNAAIEYIWLKTTDPGTPAGSTWNVTTISGATGATYDPPTISQTTWYRRCSRRAGCSSYDAESNWVKKELSCCNCAGNLVQNNSFEQGTYYWTAAGGNLSAGGGAIQCGSYSGDFQITNASSNGVYQEIYPATYAQGSILNISVYAGTHNNTYDNWVGLYFYDANWNWITSSTQQVDKVLANSPVGPQQYTWTYALPANVGHIQVAYGGNGSWTKTDSWCVTQTSGCTAAITGLRFYDMVGTNNVTITNGGTYPLSSLPSTFSLEALLTGNMESVKFTVSGSGSSTNIENTYPWNSPASGSSWSLGTGTFTVTVQAYPLDNAVGNVCATATFNFTITTCDNITNGGAIGYDQLLCGTSADPALIQNVTSPTGGTGTIEYVWLQSYDGGTTYTTISTATSDTYDPPVITQTTWYRRCARRAGCSTYVGESNWVKKELCPIPTANAGSAQTITCTTTSATLGVAAVSGYTYSWSPSAGLSATNIAQPVATPLQTTTYTVTVTNACGCTATSTVTVTYNKSNPTAVAGNGGSITCTSNTSGIAIGTTSTSGYTYSWSPATGLSSATVSNPTANPAATTTYTVTVTGSNGCTATSAVTITVDKSAPTANAGTGGTITCTSNTSGIAIGTTSTSGYTYSWSPATGLSSATVSNPTANPTATTTYTVTVTGSNGCTATSSVTITINKTTPTAVAGTGGTITCTSNTSGIAIGTTSTSGYTYSWSPASGLSSATVSNPMANPTATTTYTVTVTGSNGCTATSAVTITVDKSAPTANAGTGGTITCTSNTSGIAIGTTSTSGYTYSWSPATGLSSATVSNPTANPTATTTYTVTVTGSNGCTATSSVTITVNKTTPTAVAGTGGTITCTSNTSGIAIGTTSTSGYTYSWSPASGLSSSTVSNPTANPAATTTYTVTVTGSNGCTATSAVTITVDKSAPTANAGTGGTITCTSNTSGIAIGTASTSGYTYSWSPATGLSSATVSNPTANPTATTTYTVTVTGSNGCTATSSVNITVNKTTPTAVAGTGGTITCTSNTSGIAIGTTSTSGYTYSWSPAIGLSSATVSNPTANPTATTTYTVTVTGSNGCTATSSVVITVNKTTPSADAGPDKLINCSTTSVILGTSAVVGNSYSWSPSTGLSSSIVPQPTATPNVTTTYTLTVTNAASGCTTTDVVVVTVDNTAPTANAGPDKTINCTTTSVTLGTASVSGYSYSWSPSTGLSATNIAQPIATPTSTIAYTVTVTAANGCTATDVVLVTVNTGLPTADAGPDKNLNCTTTSATIGTTLVAGYTYSWSPSNGLSANNIAQPTASPSATTVYTLTVTNANGCTSTDVVNVNVNNTAPNSGITGPTAVCATEYLSLSASPTNASFTYSWSATGGAVPTGITTNSTITYAWPSAAQNTTQTVTLTVTNINNGCSSVYTYSVNVTTEVFANAGPDKTICQGGATLIGATPSGPAGATYFWTPNYFINSTSVANPTVNPPVSTTYTLTTTLNGCIKTDIVVVNVNVLLGPGADAGPSSISTCANQPIVLGGNPTSSTAGVSYIWTPSTGLNSSNIANPTLTTATGGYYKVRVTSNQGCYNEDSILVNITPCVNINGNVYIDNNGPANVDGTPTATAGATQLYANLTNNSGVVIATMPITSGGSYQFTFLTPNTTYGVVLSTTQGTVGSPAPSTALPTGWSNVSEDCCDNSGNDGTTNGTLTVPVATTDVFNANFGITQPLSVGNLVWNDIDKDGLRGASELGIAGATVSIYVDANSDGTPDGAALQTTTTNSNGLYIFNGLTPGNYVVGVVPPTVVTGNPYQSTPVNEANPNSNGDNNDNGINTVSGQTFSGTISLAAGSEPAGETPNNGSAPDANSNLTLDFGFYQPINLSGNVYVDNNGPTNVDGTPTGTAGTTPLFANLVGPNGNVVAVVPVNSNGTFQFNDVQPNTTYNVVLSPTQGTVGSPAPSPTLPNGWSNVSEDCCDNTGNDGNTNGIVVVTVGTSSVTNANFGITEPMSVGNLVWNDVNKNGVKDISENGIAGATVYIYNDANSDGTPDGAALQTTTTNTNGLYIFNGLTPGNYVIGVVPPTPSNGAPYTSTPINETNANNDVDNNDNGITSTAGQTYSGTITLNPGTEPTGETPNNGTAPDASSNLTIDFGFYQAINLSGTLFIDNNGPGVIDGTPTGSAGTTQMYVNLVNVSTGLIVGSMPLNSNGTYLFSDIQPNTNYVVVLSQTQGTIGNPAPGTILPDDWVHVGEDCCDNTGNDGNPNGILSVSVANSNVINANFGITQKLSLGNLVWNDDNNNGIKDANENGIANATVKLYEDANGDCIADGSAIGSRSTDANGLYAFDNLMPGKYILGVTPPAVTGGTYQSSTNGQELNPNSDVDNNDNGTVAAGTEVRSCTITLLGGTEPTGETPNNGSSSDVNSNLTVDFGFYVCPDPFIMAPVEVCANDFINLASLEPVGFTGGVWTDNGTVITNLLVNAGTYVYTFTKGTCTATGTQVVTTQVPDYAPTIAITPSIVFGNKPVRVVITINELLNKASCTPLYVFVPRLEPRYTFTWNPTATQFGTGAAGSVNNADWQYFTSNPNFYIWKYVGAATFPANGQSKFGYVGTYDPSNTDGETTYSVQIFQGSGGELNLVNNTDSELLIYYRQ